MKYVVIMSKMRLKDYISHILQFLIKLYFKLIGYK